MIRFASNTLLVILLGIVATTAWAEDNDDRARIRPEGVRAILGVAMPDNADAAFLWGGAANLGTVWKPWLNLTAGLTRWSSDIDRASYGQREGSVADLRAYTNLGVEFMEISGLQGYLDLGVGAHFVDYTIASNEPLADALGGTNLGAEIAYGLASTRGSLRISAEVRRQFADDVGNWSFTVGVGTRWGDGN